MMTVQPLQPLRDLLIYLYDPDSITRVLYDAGMDPSSVDLAGSAQRRWQQVLMEADRAGRVANIVQVAKANYPNRAQELEQAYQRYASQPEPEPEKSNTNSSVGQSAEESSGKEVVDPGAAGPDVVKSNPVTPKPASTNQSEVGSQQETGDSEPVPVNPAQQFEIPADLRLTEIERTLLSQLFADAQRIQVIKEFTEGRTATRVFLVRPFDAQGFPEVQSVVKVGPRPLIEGEWRANRSHVSRKLPGFVSVDGQPIYRITADGTPWGGLRFGQVGAGIFDVDSLARYADRAFAHDMWYVLEKRLFVQLGELWQGTLGWETLTMQNSYDPILPVNLIAEPLDANPSSGYQPIPVDAKQIAQGTSSVPGLFPGNFVRLENFVIQEIDPIGNEVTLNLPDGSQSAITSYRVRLRAVAAAEALEVGDTMPQSVGKVVETRSQLLQQYAQENLKPPINLNQAQLELAGNEAIILPNPLFMVPMLLQRSHQAKFGTIHGDLNLRNILVDVSARTPYLIDASAHRNHLLQDLLRLERDTLTELLARTLFQEDLPMHAVHQLYVSLHCAMVRDAHTPGHFAIPTDLATPLQKIYTMLVTLRQTAQKFLSDRSNWDEYYAGLILHLLGSLKFKDLDKAPAGHQPKAIAFWAAATVCWLMEGAADCKQIEWRFLDVASPQTNSNAAHSIDPKQTSPESTNQPSSPSDSAPQPKTHHPQETSSPPSSNLPSNPSRNLSDEEKASLSDLLKQHKRNLQHLLKQKAVYGAGETSLRILNQIEEEEKEIRELERKLAE